MIFAALRKDEDGWPLPSRGPGSLVEHGRGGTYGCLSCGWSGIAVTHGGVVSLECPSCELAAQTDRLYESMPREVRMMGKRYAGTRTVRREVPLKVERNAPCPCGSGRKAKKCGCGILS